MATKYASASGNWSTMVWWTTSGGTTVTTAPTTGDTAEANGKTVTIDSASITCDYLATASGGSFSVTSGGKTINASVAAGTTGCLGISHTSGTVTVNGVTVAAGTSNNALGISISGTGGTTNINMSGAITGGTGTGTSTHGISISNAPIVVISALSLTAATGSGTSGCGISITGACNLTVTLDGGLGNVTAGAGANFQRGIYVNAGATVVLNGNVVGSTANNNSQGCYCDGANCNVTINGNATGGGIASAHGAQLNSNGTLIVNGIGIGGSVTNAIGVINSTTGTVRVTTAKGNDFGSGSVGLTGCEGVSGSQTGVTTVKNIQYGLRGQTPTSGIIKFLDDTTNSCNVLLSTGSTKNLVDATSTGYYPSQSDVRYGVSYAAGVRVGTCYVPPAASVAYGVNVDNTTGTAYLTQSNIQTAMTAQGYTSTRAGYLDLINSRLDVQISTLGSPMQEGSLVVLSSDGLDNILTTAPSGVASNFREMIVQLWRRFFKKSTLDNTSLNTYADDGTTVITTQTISRSGATQTQGDAS